MFKAFLNSIVIMPVLLGLLTAAKGRGRRAVWLLIALVFAYDLAYLLLLYFLRTRWVG